MGRSGNPPELEAGHVVNQALKVGALSDERNTAELEGRGPRNQSKEGWMDKVTSLRWTGLQKLGDKEYASMLGEKVLQLEVEIALINDRIEKLREEDRLWVKGRQGAE
ncbi:MAG: hypothetical protein Q9163_003764 [Psora crenata]